MSDVLTINMNPPRPASCWRCGAECGGDNCGLPVFNGEIVSPDWEDDWGGVPCCRKCLALYDAGKLPMLRPEFRTIWGTF